VNDTPAGERTGMERICTMTRRSSHYRLKLTAATALAALVASSAHGQTQAPVDLSGFWELRDDSKHVGKAEFTEAYQARPRTLPKFNAIVNMASRWCHPLGTPFIMGDSAPLDLIQGKQELAITAEVQSAARHIYLDGRQHPNVEEFDNTTNGHSIGRWDGNVLVVDTVGFSDVGMAVIPGGGLRSGTTRLVERYELRNNGQELNVQFTWTDPEMYAKPNVYDFTYHRAKPGEYAREYFCDASDEARGESVEMPEQ
jgi:hypothetical protein